MILIEDTYKSFKMLHHVFFFKEIYAWKRLSPLQLYTISKVTGEDVIVFGKAPPYFIFNKVILLTSSRSYGQYQIEPIHEVTPKEEHRLNILQNIFFYEFWYVNSTTSFPFYKISTGWDYFNEQFIRYVPMLSSLCHTV